MAKESELNKLPDWTADRSPDEKFQNMADKQFSLSVVLPWCEDRGEDTKHLQKWTEGQKLPRENYQLVVGYSAEDSDALTLIQSVLAPGDLAIASPCGEALSQWQEAILAAEGDWVFVTELHCLPDSETLAQICKVASETELDAFVVKTGHINKSDVAWMEEQTFHEIEPELTNPDQWNLLRLRGFAIRRDWVHKLGGFKTEYDLFAEIVMSLELDRMGAKVGTAFNATVYHVNQFSMPLHRDDIIRFVFGEMKYRHDFPEENWLQYLDIPLDTIGHWQLIPARSRRLLKETWKTALATNSEAFQEELVGRLPHLFFSSLFGHLAVYLKLLSTHLRWEAQFAVMRGRTMERYSVYRNQTISHVALCRLKEYFRLRSLSHTFEQRIESDGQFECKDFYSNNDKQPLPLEWLGFSGLETHNGKTFRWGTSPCGWRVALAPGTWNFEIETGGLRSLDDLKHAVAYWNGRQVKVVPIDDQRLEVRSCVQVDSSPPTGELILHLPTLKNLAAEELRELALPVYSLKWKRSHGLPE